VGPRARCALAFALDAASFNGFSIATRWQDARSLLGQKGTPMSGILTDNLNYFLKSRTFDGDGLEMLTSIGAGRMYTINLGMISQVSGAITPLGYEDPFFLG
jgi:hypothetical protein